MEASQAEITQVLAAIPQQAPFRFIDEIVEIDESHAVGRYRFRDDESFYAGHFPGDPITPGVILIEAMAQAGVVSLGIFLDLRSHEQGTQPAQAARTLFTDANVEFAAIVRPGDVVTTTATKVFFRRGKLAVDAEMRLADGSLACSGRLAGMIVRAEP